MRTPTLFALACLPALACVPPGNGNGGGADASNEVPASAQIVVEEFIEGATMVVAIGAPMASTGNDFDENASEEDQQGHVEGGVGGDGGGDGKSQPNAAPAGEVPTQLPNLGAATLVNPDCLSFAWVGLTVTITYDQCMTEEGSSVDGALTLGIELIPLRFFVAMDTLQVDTVTYDGTIGLAFSGAQGMRTTSLDVDFSYDDGSETAWDVDQLSLAILENNGVRLSGAGAITTPTLNTSMNATDVVWTDCTNPEGGTLYYDDGSVEATVTFLPTTPDDGVVTVNFGLGPIDVALLPPCS